MRIIILAAALALAAPAWGQAPEAKPEAKKPSAAKPQALGKAVAKSRKATAKRHQDARHCLQRGTNDAIIRCAEEYL